MPIMSNLRRFIVPGMIVLFVLLLPSTFYDGIKAEGLLPPETEQQHQEKAVKNKQGGKEPAKNTFVKLISDQRIPFNGSVPPPTRIDLAGFYEAHEVFKDGKAITAIVAHGDEKIVRSRIEDRELVLEWRGIGKTQITLKTTDASGEHDAVYENVRLEMFVPNYLMMFCTLLGGVGIFLLGMKNLSEGMQTLAGERLRSMIGTLTDNRFLAVGVGIVTTGLIQSSSVTTVIVVGFVNSQIMALSQAIGVIMGANIGTTLTAWIMTLSIDKFGLPVIGISVLFYMFTKWERGRFIAMTVLGLAFIFFGLQLMQDALASLRDLPDFTMWMEKFTADTYVGVLSCAAIGCILTLLVQSSSATIGITISLAAIGVIRFETAMALVLGENIGTTITALLASIGMSANARRAAYFHVIFNVVGVLWVTLLFLPLDLPGLITKLVGTDPATGQIANIKVGIALTHTLFNTTNTIIFLPFTQFFANLLTRIVPDSDGDKNQSRLTGLNVRLLETAAISIERSRIEVQRMGNCCKELAATVQAVAEGDGIDRKLADEAFRQEETLDTLQDEIIAFTSSLLSGNISHDVAEIATNQLKMADEIESIGDYFVQILKSNLKLKEANLEIPSPIHEEMSELHDRVEEYLAMLFRYYAQRRHSADILPIEHTQGKTINATAKKIRDQFIVRMSDEKIDPQLIIAINSQINAYRRVREHGRNVAEAIAGIR